MPKQSVNKPFISVRDKKMMLENEHYRKFAEEKQEIRNKYDKRLFFNTGVPTTIKLNKWFREEGRWEYRKYLNEIYDVMMKADSDFGKFVEDVEPEMVTKKRERYK